MVMDGYALIEFSKTTSVPAADLNSDRNSTLNVAVRREREKEVSRIFLVGLWISDPQRQQRLFFSELLRPCLDGSYGM